MLAKQIFKNINYIQDIIIYNHIYLNIKISKLRKWGSIKKNLLEICSFLLILKKIVKKETKVFLFFCFVSKFCYKFIKIFE